MTTYQIIKVIDDPMINKLIITDISVKRVTKDSKNPAAINSGINPTMILTPSFAAIKNDCRLE